MQSQSEFMGPFAGLLSTLGAIALALVLTLSASQAIAGDNQVNLNAADASALQYIPGIGESRAEEIIRLRTRLGGFTSYEQLLEVPGIGEKILENIRHYGALDGGVSELTQEMIDNPAQSVDVTAGETGSEVSG